MCYKKGEKIYLKGPSGSGKTTFLNLLTGLIQITNGNILFDGKKLKNNLVTDLLAMYLKNRFYLKGLYMKIYHLIQINIIKIKQN